MTYDITLPSAVSASSITRADKTPTSITFTVERQIRKSVEVKGDFSNVRIAEGFMLDSTSFDYDSITVEGPESIVGTIDCAQVTLDRSNVDKTITETVSYVLLDKDGNQVDTSELTLSADAVEVTMKIVKYKVVPLEVEFIDGGGAKAETDVTYTADIQAVTLSGDVTVLDGLNSIQLEPIDLSTLSSNDETITRTILIPNDVKNVSGQEEVHPRHHPRQADQDAADDQHRLHRRQRRKIQGHEPFPAGAGHHPCRRCGRAEDPRGQYPHRRGYERLHAGGHLSGAGQRVCRRL